MRGGGEESGKGMEKEGKKGRNEGVVGCMGKGAGQVVRGQQSPRPL